MAIDLDLPNSQQLRLPTSRGPGKGGNFEAHIPLTRLPPTHSFDGVRTGRDGISGPQKSESCYENGTPKRKHFE